MEKEKVLGWVLVVPALTILFSIVIYPFAWMIYQSFFYFDYSSLEFTNFVGFANYIDVLTHYRFQHALVFTVMIAATAIAVEFFLGLFIANCINSLRKGREFFTTSCIASMIFPPVAAALTWYMLFDSTYGPINYILGIRGFGWRTQLPWPFFAVLCVDVWMWTPFFILIFTAALRSLPQAPYEAAKVDGLSSWQIFWRITLPQLNVAIAIVLLLRLVEVFQIFGEIILLTFGGPGYFTESLTYWAYIKAFHEWALGTASAGAIIYWILMFTICTIIFRFVAYRMIAPEER